ncbi:MAG: hypothetical protein ACYDBW_05940 [Sulfuricaulis sp.]
MKKVAGAMAVVVLVVFVFYILAVKSCSRTTVSKLSDTCANVLKTNGLTQDTLSCAAVCTQMEMTQKEAAAHTLTSDKLFQVSLLHSCYREIKGSDCRCGSGKAAK